MNKILADGWDGEEIPAFEPKTVTPKVEIPSNAYDYGDEPLQTKGNMNWGLLIGITAAIVLLMAIWLYVKRRDDGK